MSAVCICSLQCVFANPTHPICAAGIRDATQVTMLVVANRDAIGAFVTDCDKWLEDNKKDVNFNVAIVTRQSLFDVYGQLWRSAVAFTLW